MIPFMWKPIIGHNGYEVSDLGEVRSLDRTITKRRYGKVIPVARKGSILSQGTNGKGYKSITMGRGNQALVHRLVLEAFISPPPYAGAECRHKNNDKADNRAENLEWGTSRDNKMDNVRDGIHHYSKRTHCKHGHEFTAENTRVRLRKDGTVRERVCLACRKRRNSTR